ncbi:hypothetical protein NQZ79_g2266 [Umbelopsis isabellina]|nr:hypothetical protein NQZ79_g2266 [Umbelopsis isabellina]
MKTLTLFVSAMTLLASTASAAPLQKRAQLCGQYSTQTEGQYIVNQDEWNEGAATSGSQCSQVNSLTGNDLAWQTSWTWAGGSGQVKSYANAGLNFTPTQISAITTIPIKFYWTYSGSNLVADVSFDMFTSSSSSGAHENEIMVWLTALGGALPITSTGDSIGTVTVAGTTFKLYSGPNGSTTVWSFVAESAVNNMAADLIDFYDYLTSNGHISSSQYLQVLQGGTEAFTGSNAEFTCSLFYAAIN